MAVGWEGSRRPGQNSSQGMDAIILLPPSQQKAGPETTRPPPQPFSPLSPWVTIFS